MLRVKCCTRTFHDLGVFLSKNVRNKKHARAKVPSHLKNACEAVASVLLTPVCPSINSVNNRVIGV